MDGIIFISEIDPKDFDGKVREVSEYLFENECESVEGELCNISGQRFCKNISPKQKGFLIIISRLVKNRRKAPIYWPLQTTSEHSRFGFIITE